VNHHFHGDSQRPALVERLLTKAKVESDIQSELIAYNRILDFHNVPAGTFIHFNTIPSHAQPKGDVEILMFLQEHWAGSIREALFLQEHLPMLPQAA